MYRNNTIKTADLVSAILGVRFAGGNQIKIPYPNNI